MRRTVLIKRNYVVPIGNSVNHDTTNIKNKITVDFDFVGGATKEINGILEHVPEDRKHITAQVWNEQYNIKAKQAEEKYLDKVPSLSTFVWSAGFGIVTNIITQGDISTIYSFPVIFSVFYGAQIMDRKSDLKNAYKKAMASDFVYNNLIKTEKTTKTKHILED